MTLRARKKSTTTNGSYQMKCLGKLLSQSALLIFFLIGLYCPAGAQGEVKIGVILPLSGRLESTGREMRQAFELAAETANREIPGLSMTIARWQGIPGLGGAKVKLLFGDHRSDPARGADVAARFIREDEVAGILGCYNSTVTKSVSEVCEKAKVPMFTATSKALNLTTQGNRWFWRTTPNNLSIDRYFFYFLKALTEGKAGMPYRIPLEEIREIVLLGEDSDMGDQFLSRISRLGSGYGFKIPLSVRYPRNSEGFSIQARAAARAKPGVLALISQTADAVKYIKTFKELGLSPRVIWGRSMAFRDVSFGESLKEDALGVLTGAEFIPALFKSLPLARGINNLYRKKTGKDMDGVAARAFTGLQAFMHVLDKAGSKDVKAIQSAANGLEMPASELILPWRGIRFGGEQQKERGQNVLGAGLVAQWQSAMESGVPALEIVYPPQFATADLIYPFPGWE